MYFNNLIGRLTYGKEPLNFRKTGDFHKTNHPGFAASVRHPSWLVKTNGKPTKRIVVLSGLSVPEVIALRTRKSRRTLAKQVILTKRIIPASLLLSLRQLV
jgi:hypothetical protein